MRSAWSMRASGAGRDPGFGAVGDAEAGGLASIGKIIGAVADGERLGERETFRRGDFLQRAELGVMAEDRLDHLAGELAVLNRRAYWRGPRRRQAAPGSRQ